MDERYVMILNRHTPQLQTNVQMDIILTSLRKDAGGFLTDMEYQDVNGQQTNPQKVVKMLTHLKGKENAAFFKFCDILQENGYAIVEKLKKDVGSDVPSSSENDAPTDTAHISATKIKQRISGIKDLMPYSDPLSSKLWPLGIGLGLVNFTKATMQDYVSPQDKCLKILDKWLQVTVNPTWEDFCSILRQPGLEMIALANKIAADHI